MRVTKKRFIFLPVEENYPWKKQALLETLYVNDGAWVLAWALPLVSSTCRTSPAVSVLRRHSWSWKRGHLRAVKPSSVAGPL